MLKNQNNPLYGLVLSGGNSMRMGKDKGNLQYFNTSQNQRACDLLASLTQHVFISLKKKQHCSLPHPYKRINDNKAYLQFIFENKQANINGPIIGILSAAKRFPKASWLVLACDLPFVEKKTLLHLIKKRDETKLATTYLDKNNLLPEPLCTIYEKKALPLLKDFFKKRLYCPRKFLLSHTTQVNTLPSINPKWLENINTKEEYKKTLFEIQTQKNEN